MPSAIIQVLWLWRKPWKVKADVAEHEVACVRWGKSSSETNPPANVRRDSAMLKTGVRVRASPSGDRRPSRLLRLGDGLDVADWRRNPKVAAYGRAHLVGIEQQLRRPPSDHDISRLGRAAVAP
jgi:hypothetical protein